MVEVTLRKFRSLNGFLVFQFSLWENPKRSLVQKGPVWVQGLIQTEATSIESQDQLIKHVE